MRWFIAFCFLFLFSCFADAQTVIGGAQSLQFNWVPPVLRENGSALPAVEIGGYELRYRIKGATAFNSVIIPGGATKAYSLSGLASGEYDFQIAAFDVEGLYSAFVAINYKLSVSPPKVVTGFTVKRPGVDVLEICLSSPNCKVSKGEGQ